MKWEKLNLPLKSILENVIVLLILCVYFPVLTFLTGPLIGMTSDRCTSRFGRRRPVMVIALIITWLVMVWSHLDK